MEWARDGQPCLHFDASGPAPLTPGVELNRFAVDKSGCGFRMDMDAGRTDDLAAFEGHCRLVLTFEKLIASACESTPAEALLNTLHCSSGTAGSAAQFNQSVSAMPCYVSSHINAPRQGTADTLSKR